MSYLKNKITEERDKIDPVERFDFEYHCTKELKTHPQDMGFLTNIKKPEKLKRFEFYPDFEFECTRSPYMTFKQYKQMKDIYKGMCV